MLEETASGDDWFVIANPAAGGGRLGRRWPELEGWLRRHIQAPSTRLTERPGHATELAVLAIEQGYRRLLAVGGDGTCHEVVNGILGQRVAASTDVTLALFPVGTGNDWIRTFRIPRQREAWLAMLQQGHTLLQDAGHVSYTDPAGRPAERYFFNAAGLAFDAFVTKMAAEGGRRWSTAYYLLLILRYLMGYQATGSRVRFDGQERSDRFITIEAGIGRFVGGGLQLMPHAEPADGRLALTLAHNTGKLDILLNIWRFFDGSIGRHPKVELHQVAGLQAESTDDSPLLLEADGEFLGNGPVRIKVLERALRVVAPSSG